MHIWPGLNEGCVVRELFVGRPQARIVKAIAEASDGLCGVFGDGTGRLVLVAMGGREAELDRLVVDLYEELERVTRMPPRLDPAAGHCANRADALASEPHG